MKIAWGKAKVDKKSTFFGESGNESGFNVLQGTVIDYQNKYLCEFTLGGVDKMKPRLVIASIVWLCLCTIHHSITWMNKQITIYCCRYVETYYGIGNVY